MAKTHGKSATIFWEGYNLTAYLNSVTINGKADTAESSTFGLSSKTYLAGLIDATLSIGGLYDPGTGSDVALLNSALAASSNHTITVFPQGDTLGNDGWGCAAFGTGISINTNLGSAVMISGEVQSSVGVELIKSQKALAAVTSPANAGTVDGGAQTTTGGVGYLHVTAFSGTDITISIQDSADDITYADVLVFTQVTAANAKERKTTAAGATVKRYTQASWLGTFSSVTFVCGFGRTPRT